MYGTTAALPFGTIVIIIVIWALVTFPLTVVGGIMGKNTKVRAGAGGVCQSWGGQGWAGWGHGRAMFRHHVVQREHAVAASQ